jgi:hypothetical protein
MALSDNVIRDGDAGFIGFASRLNPLTLPAGMLQDSVNMRLDRGVAQTRRGSKRLTDTVGTTGAPLTLDFTLGTDKSVTSITRATATATVTCTAHGFTSGDQVNIRGANQSEYNGDFLVTVTDANTFTYTVSGTPATPATGTIIANEGPVVRDSYDGGLYAAGVFSSQNYENANEYVVLAANDQAFLWRDGVSPVIKNYPTAPDERIEGTDTVSVVQAFDRLYILREADRTVTGWTEKLTTASGITVSSTTATVNVTAHGYPEGARVRIEGSTTPAFDGHEFAVLGTNLNTNSFEITVPSGTATHAAAGIKVRRTKPPIYWDGGSGNFVRAAAGVPSEGVTYTKMPSTGWASYINNRLWFARNRDTVAISDVLDADLYDPFWNSFRVGAGGNDRIVAVHPWVEGQALIFCRKSIWLASLNEFASTDGSDFSVDTPVSQVTQLTNEIGCSARNTIVTAGQYVFFLSDAGIYRLDAGRVDLKLRGDTMPLSEPIADLFATVNQARVEKSAFAVWHDNRYLIALPTTSEPLDGNQLVLCWNSLNSQWEYRDTYPSSAAVNQILVASYANKRRVFSIPRSGNLYLLEEVTTGTDDQAAGNANATNPVNGQIKTRRYDFKEMSSKRFLRTVSNAVIPNGATVTTTANIIDPDKTEQIGSITNTSGSTEDYHLKSPVRFKAHACELIYETSGGRPEIRSVALEASPKSLPATLTRNES